MDVAKELAIRNELSGFSQQERQAHNDAVAKLRANLTEYSQHCESLFAGMPYSPIDDIVLVLAPALGKERLPELVSAVSSAAYKLEANRLAVNLDDLAHDAHIKQQAQAFDEEHES